MTPEERTAVPGEALPPLPEECYPPGARPLPTISLTQPVRPGDGEGE